MNIIFLIGLEGSGHHLFVNCCKYNKQLTKQLNDLLLQIFNNKINMIDKKQYLTKLDSFIYANQNRNELCIITSSFPYYRPLNTLNRYDILEFYNIFNKHNKYIKLFFIVLYRNIIHSTLSSYNRFDKDKSIIYCAKVQEDNLIYINNTIQLIPKNKFIIVDYYNICNNIKSFEYIIFKKSNISINFNNNIQVSDYNKYNNTNNYNYLKNRFNENYLKLFNYILNNIVLL